MKRHNVGDRFGVQYRRGEEEEKIVKVCGIMYSCQDYAG